MTEASTTTSAPAGRSTTFKILVAMLAAVAISVPTAVYASHQFSDVPDSYAFHDEIDRIADAGITTGFSDGTFRPSDTVRRGPMAAFMGRMGGRTAMATNPNTASFTDVSKVNIDNNSVVVPGVDGTQLVSVHAWFSIDGNSTACPCEVGIRVVEYASDGTTVLQGSPWAVHSVTAASGDIDETVSVSYAFTATSGNHVYVTEGIVWGAATSSNLGSDPLELKDSASVAITTPFGSGGSTSLATAAATSDLDTQVADRPRG